jgi:hypothetical protein
MKKIFTLLVFMCGLAILPVWAQEAVPPPQPDYQPLSPEQMDQLLGPIALYPDPLMAEILPASTLPTEIVLADRYISGGGDPNLADQQPWDASVQALAHYPNVLQWLDENLSWTTEVGEAFLNQQQDVMDSIQRLRTAAYNLGNLQSTAQQQVVNDGGYIEILPVNSDEVYLPDYQPDEVYYQSGFGLTFGTAFPIGAWLNCDFDWHDRHLIVWDHDHPRPHDWWHQRPGDRNAAMAGHTTEWRPVNRPGFVAGGRGDRGWNNNPAVGARNPIGNRPVSGPHNVAGVNRPGPGRAPIVNRPEPFQREAPAPVRHEEPTMSRPASTGAFIGIQNSHQTREFSDRGQQSMQTVTHSAPVSRPAPSFNPGGGGGGGGGGNRGGGGRH